MKTWFIPVSIRQLCAFNEACSCIEHRALKNGEMALFNKNSLRYQYFSNCKKVQNRYGYVGEADQLDQYFSNVITEESA